MTGKQKRSQMTALGYCDLKWVKVESIEWMRKY